MDKLGLHINNLMETIRSTDEKPFVRELALEELKKLNSDISSFIFNYIDEIEELPQFEEDTDNRAKKLYMEHWTCGICGKHTHEVDYDYLSGTDHLECVLGKEKKNQKQLELEL
tara:strand:- start:446 stop:787 length:342 start_codon:yes stop_codon:yes gene_type:complete